MCIIACTPAGLKLDKGTFDRCWDKNPDGFGMAYLWNGTIRIKKTMDKKEAWQIYRGVCQHSMDSWKILHWRIGTHGVKDINNCHPFMVHDNLVFAHNGIINAAPQCPDGVKSDTQMFNDLILKFLPLDFYKYSHYKILLEEFIGHSKLTFLDTENKLYIFNQEKGEWHDGVWFSNSGYKEQPVVYYPPVPKQQRKRIVDMSDYEFKEHCEQSYKNLYTYTYKQCEYCTCYKSNTKLYKNIGYLCKECEEGIPIEITDETTLDELLESLFAPEKTPTGLYADSYPADKEWDSYFLQQYYKTKGR